MRSEVAIAIAGMALVMYLTRIGGFWLVGRLTPTPRVTRIIEQLGGVTLVALTAPAVVNRRYARHRCGCRGRPDGLAHGQSPGRHAAGYGRDSRPAPDSGLTPSRNYALHESAEECSMSYEYRPAVLSFVLRSILEILDASCCNE